MGLLKALNIEKGEGTSVALMMAQSFFLGAFIMTFQISTNSLFLKEVGGDSLAVAYMISGGIGIVLTSFFSVLQKRISFSILANITYVVVAASTLLLWFGFDAELMPKKDLIYIAFLIVGPFIALVAYITFWGVMGRVFSLRQGKRLFGLIDSGQILAMIIVSFSIPFVMASIPATKDLIFISGACLSVAFLLQILVSINFRKELASSSDNSEDEKTDDQAKISNYLKNPYIVMMATFVFLSMLAQFFVEFSFMKTVNNQYPIERDLTNFFGYFMAILLIFSFVFKTFVYGKLIQMYGLKVNLLILPLVLVFFTIIASVAGIFSNYEGDPGTFTFFFMFIISSKLFAQSLRGAIEVPAFKIMYQPLEKSIRFDVQARIDGFVNELSAFLGGVILTVLNLIGFKLIHFSWLLIPIIVAWGYLTIKLYDKYKEALRASLSNLKSVTASLLNDSVAASKNIYKIIENEIKGSHSDRTINAIKISGGVSPMLLLDALEESINSKNKFVRSYSSAKLLDEREFSSLDKINNSINNEEDNEIKNNLTQLIEENKELSKNRLTELQLYKMARSKNAKERKKLTKILLLKEYEEYNSLLVELLKDLDASVRKEAILATTILNIKDLYLPMIENIAQNQFKNVVKSAILKIGEPILEDLNTAFYKSGFSTKELILIVDLIGQINGEKSKEYLVSKLTVHDLQVIDAVLNALSKCNFQSDEEHKGKIIQAIDDAIGITMWNYASLLEIKQYKFSDELLNAISVEIKGNLNQIFTLLGLLYDPKSIKHIKQNIESGTSEGIGFAIELLDIFVDEQLKLKLFPIIDDLTVEDRIKILQLYYPRFELTKEEALKAILNRSYSELNRWTKACALNEFLIIENGDFHNDIVAHLFNQDMLLKETAALVLHKIDKMKFSSVLTRIDENDSEILTHKIADIENGNDISMFNKVLLLKNNSFLSNIDGYDLSLIVDKLYKKIHLKDDVIYSKGNQNEFLSFIWKGRVILRSDDRILLNYSTSDGYSNFQIVASDNENSKFIALENIVEFAIENNNIFQLISENDSIADAFMKLFNLRFNEVNSD